MGVLHHSIDMTIFLVTVLSYKLNQPTNQPTNQPPLCPAIGMYRNNDHRFYLGVIGYFFIFFEDDGWFRKRDLFL
jgi:hypothetical protein